jgi:hypothetical protein
MSPTLLPPGGCAHRYGLLGVYLQRLTVHLSCWLQSVRDQGSRWRPQQSLLIRRNIFSLVTFLMRAFPKLPFCTLLRHAGSLRVSVCVCAWPMFLLLRCQHKPFISRDATFMLVHNYFPNSNWNFGVEEEARKTARLFSRCAVKAKKRGNRRSDRARPYRVLAVRLLR